MDESKRSDFRNKGSMDLWVDAQKYVNNSGWMQKWVDGLVFGWTRGWLGELMDTQINRKVDRQMNGLKWKDIFQRRTKTT